MAADPYQLAGMAAAAIADRTGVPRHDVLVVLGSGWAGAAEAFGPPVASVPVGELPGFVTPVADGHLGVLSSHRVGDAAVLVVYGRTHLYEGHGPSAVAHPVRAAAAAGCRIGVLTNANGSLREDWQPGTGVLIRDHLNLTGVSPLAGARFVDLTGCWSPRLRALAREVEPSLVEGVYALMPGPQYETAAEAAMLRTLGADLVGMSTVLEAIAAREAGMELLGLSAVAAVEATGLPLDPAGVVRVAAGAAAPLGGVIDEVIRKASCTEVRA
jgi:purine-nucleoside phosphorylase